MLQPPAGSIRDTAALADRYAETSIWQHERGLLLIDVADPSGCRNVVDLGCGTGGLTVELARRGGPTGRVFGVDPDPARLQHARRTAPAELTNLTYIQAPGDDLRAIADGTVDLVYSNYALHWMVRPAPVFDELWRVLRPGGRFVVENLGKPIAFFFDLVAMMRDQKAHRAENIFLDEAQWRAIIEPRGFEIHELTWPRFTLDFQDLPALFAWLEATSHGAFDSAKLTPDDRAALMRQYPGTASFECIALRMILRKPE
jgi:ubiquinone/menaquinone biosynthesis C-methylase UbiE